MTAYYNENDPKAAEWLRQLIRAGLIASGEVDERSIEDVRPEDIAGFRQGHFFAGIGGWSYALRLAGWPDDRPVWTGSCPCQPFSAAGNRQGTDDERHLWPHWRWLIDQRHPPVVFGEQVASKDGRAWLAGVRSDLETMGYPTGAADLCAAGIGAPHIRQRLWWVADARCVESRQGRIPGSKESQRVEPGVGSGVCGAADGLGNTPGRGRRIGGDAVGSRRGRHSDSPEQDRRLADTDSERRRERPARSEDATHVTCPGEDAWSGIYVPCADGKTRRIEPGLEPLVNGLPGRVGLLRGYGNAIVPLLAAQFVSAYMDTVTDQQESK